MMKLKFYWHVHHDKLFEYIHPNITERREYVKKSKAGHEIKTRLRLMKPIPEEKLPALLQTAITRYEVAHLNRVSAEMAVDKLEKELRGAHKLVQKLENQIAKTELRARNLGDREFDFLEKARDEVPNKFTVKAQMEALHKKLCKKCPWDGQTIFPHKPTQDV